MRKCEDLKRDLEWEPEWGSIAEDRLCEAMGLVKFRLFLLFFMISCGQDACFEDAVKADISIFEHPYLDSFQRLRNFSFPAKSSR